MNDDIRDLLQDAVADVQPTDGLAGIRARTASHRRRRGWAWGVGGAVAATAATVAVVATLGTGGHGPARRDSTSQVASGGTRVTAYFVGTTGAGPRLFGQQVTVPPGAPALDVTVDMAVRGRASDPDYRSPWPAGTRMQHAQLANGVLSVDLSGPVVRRPSGTTATDADVAVQQLVYTVQAASGERLPVTFLLDGRPAPTVLGVDTTRPVAREAADDVLSPLSIDTPGQGARVGTTFTVRGHAATFEGNVRWQLLQGGVVFREGSTTAKECCTLAPYSFRVEAPAGSYLLKVFEEDDSDGEGVAPSSDTKQITVR